MGKMYQYVMAQPRFAKPILQSNFEVMPSSLFLDATRAFVKVHTQKTQDARKD